MLAWKLGNCRLNPSAHFVVRATLHKVLELRAFGCWALSSSVVHSEVSDSRR